MYKLEDTILHGEHKPMKDLVNQIENHMLKRCNGSFNRIIFKSTEWFPFYTKEKLESSSKRKKCKVKVIRLFLTVGSMDKAKKKDIIHFWSQRQILEKVIFQGN